MRHRAIIGALLFISAGVLRGTTVFRDDIAHATGLAGAPVTIVSRLDAQGNVKVHEQGTADVNVTNATVPVHEQGTANTREQNTDGDGNIKVHEQGTAKVHVANERLSVVTPSISADGGERGGDCSTSFDFDYPQTATALSIHMDSGVQAINFKSGPYYPAPFLGPASDGNASIELALTRPVEFDRIECVGTGSYSVSWIGNVP